MSQEFALLERAMVTALRADSELRAEVAKLLGRVYYENFPWEMDDEKSSVSEANDVKGASEASDASGTPSSVATGVIHKLTAEHVVFKLDAGWPVWTSPKGRNFVHLPITRTSRSVAKSDMADGVTTVSLLRKLGIGNKGFVAWVETKGLLDDVDKVVGTKFHPIIEDDGFVTPDDKGKPDTTKGGEVSKADKKRLRRLADHTGIVPKELGNYMRTQCLCSTIHDCPAVKKFGSTNKLRTTS